MHNPIDYAPSIILIGGKVTLDNGAKLDTRRPMQGDEWDFTLRAALGNSEAFWAKAKAITDIILAQEDSPDPWALAWVGKTVRRPKSDGTFTRVRSVRLLNDADYLMDKSLLQGNSTIRAERLKSDYRIMPYVLRFPDISVSSDPTVFVGSFHVTYDDGTDLVGMNPLSYVVSRWPSVTLVLPHTPLIERKARSLLDWWSKGARTPDRDRLRDDGIHLAAGSHPEEAERFQASWEATEEIRAADPYVIEDDLQITMWVDRGKVQEASDLDAALDFVQSRYDLSIGFWDVVRDPVLRASLLDTKESEPADTSLVELPTELIDVAKEKQADKRDKKLKEDQGRAFLHKAVWPELKNMGWRNSSGDPGKSYNLDVGPKVKSLYEGAGLEAAVSFTIIVHKRQATLNLFAVTRIEATEKFLSDHSLSVEKIAGTPPDPGTNTIIRFPSGGWDESIEEWETRLQTIEACVTELTPRLGPVIDASIAFWESQRMDFINSNIEVTRVVSPTPSGESKAPLWRRLLGGDG